MPKTKKKAASQSKKTIASKQVQSRPPVVVVMGHVDHGKTTLLDAIRSYKSKKKFSALTDKEHGGITQHIGAYQVVLKDKPITFLDTPGHEAFVKMRKRGAQAADIAILVVAANDGVKPQTKEAIKHIKSSNIPMVVAINKIDLPGVTEDMAKAQLAENEVFVEGYGGDVVFVPISAKKGEGIKQLLEMVLLVAEMQELTGSLKNPLKAYVLESFMEAGRGVVSNLVVKDGKLIVGDEVSAAVSGQPESRKKAKIKAIFDENSRKIKKVLPGQPAQVLGFKSIPPVGGLVVKAGKTKKSDMELLKNSALSSMENSVPLEKTSDLAVEKESSEEEKKNQDKKIKLIIKTDVQGSLEAIKANLTEEIELIGEGVGDIAESDVLLARSTGAELIGFNVQAPSIVVKLAEMEKIKITTYNVIYHLLEYLQEKVLKLIEPTINEEILGKAEVIAEFKMKGHHIAGCKVISGEINKSDCFRIIRDEKNIGEGKAVSFQKERQEVLKVKKGDEVGIVFKPDILFKTGDVIISYKVLK